MPLEILGLPESLGAVRTAGLPTYFDRRTRSSQDRLLFAILFLRQLRVHLAQP